jgi:hypothetical protein
MAPSSQEPLRQPEPQQLRPSVSEDHQSINVNGTLWTIAGASRLCEM